jgi:hypothetical protein
MPMIQCRAGALLPLQDFGGLGGPEERLGLLLVLVDVLFAVIGSSASRKTPRRNRS